MWYDFISGNTIISVWAWTDVEAVEKAGEPVDGHRWEPLVDDTHGKVDTFIARNVND